MTDAQPQTAAPPLIRVESLNFSYGSEPVLIDIDLDIHEGRFMGLIGPNGGGKSTLVKLILGLLRPASGRVLVRDNGKLVPLTDPGRRRLRVGYLPQQSAAARRFPATVAEVVMMGRFAGMRRLSRPGAADRDKVAEALERVGVPDLAARPIGELSGGQLQRVFLARALASDPRIVILDEPMTGIDPTAEESAYELLDRLIRELGIAVVMVTHDVATVAVRIQEVACLNRRLFCHGNPRRVLSDRVINQTFGKDVDLALHKRHTHRCLEGHMDDPPEPGGGEP